jgi:glucokinase
VTTGAEVLAIDVGGTKLSAAWVDADGTVREHRSVPTPREQPWSALAGLVSRLLADGPRAFLGVGIGTAGPVDHRVGTVSPVNIPAWRDFPLRDQIASLVPGHTVRLAGDGIGFAVGEHWLGAGRGRPDMLGVVVSTGVGGGLILGGRLHIGRTANAGHVGHLVVDLDGDACPCGGIGCVETVASGPSLVRWARANGWSADPAATARDLAGAAAAGEPAALAAFDRAGRALAAAFVSTAAVCDLDHIVIGGGVAGAGAVLFGPVREWARRLGGLDFVTDLTITPAILKEHAGLVGAAALIHHEDRYPTTL